MSFYSSLRRLFLSHRPTRCLGATGVRPSLSFSEAKISSSSGSPASAFLCSISKSCSEGLAFHFQAFFRSLDSGSSGLHAAYVVIDEENEIQRRRVRREVLFKTQHRGRADTDSFETTIRCCVRFGNSASEKLIDDCTIARRKQ